MQISAFTDEISPDSPARAIEVAKQWGLTHLEVRILPGGRFPRVSDPELAALSTQLSEAGLAVSGVSPGFFKCRWDDPSVQRGLSEDLPRACEWAKALGTDLVTCFGSLRDDSPSVPTVAVDLVGRMAVVVKRHGCRLALENEAGCWGATGLEAAGIIRQVGCDRISLCWDPANSARAGSECPYPAEYEEIKDLVSHVHAKNFDPSTGAWRLLSAGAVDWPGQIQALVRSEYGGFLVIETHLHVAPDAFRFVGGQLSDLERNTLRNLEFVRSCLGQK